jgi:hypothetical protein
VLAKVSQAGPSALRESLVARPLLAAAGRASGGLLSEEDLAEVRPESALPREAGFGARRRALVAPWSAPEAPHRLVEFVAVADAAGVMAVLGYSPDDGGVAVPELGLTLARDAIVVRRGIPRVTPGEPLPSPCPIAIGLDDHVAFIALGVRSGTPLDVGAMRHPWSDRAATGATLLAGAAQAAGGDAAGAVLRSAETGQVQKLSL